MIKKDPGEWLRIIINVLIYIIFLIFGFQQILAARDFVAKIMLSILIFAFLFIAIWYEYVRFVHRKAIYTLNFECDPDKAHAIMETCRKIDFFRGYQYPIAVFELLYYTDKQNPEALIGLINQYEKSLLKRSLDMLLVYNYSMFAYYRMISNKTQCRKFHQSLMELKDRKIKGKRISPLYNWEVLEAEIHLINQDFKKAYASLNNTNTTLMNPREMAYYYFYRLQCETALNLKKNVHESLSMIKEYASSLPIYQQAIELLGETK